MRLLDGEREDALEDQEKDGGGQVPVPGVVLDRHHPVDGHQAVDGEDQAGEDGLDRVYERGHGDEGLVPRPLRSEMF